MKVIFHLHMCLKLICVLFAWCAQPSAFSTTSDRPDEYDQYVKDCDLEAKRRAERAQKDQERKRALRVRSIDACSVFCVGTCLS